MFEHPTYVVLELPTAVGERVHDIRGRYDRRLAAFPAEITVAGSSGVGTIAPGQEATAVFRALERVAAAHLPFFTRFIAISRFAAGPVVWLRPATPTPFSGLQRSLVAAGIRFLPHKFAYTPHCSLCTSSLAPMALDALLREDFPRDTFELSSLALYEVADGRAGLVKRFQVDTG